MLYTASDAINLVYKIIGKTLTLLINNDSINKEKQKQFSLNLKEFYRYLIKKKIYNESEIISCMEKFSFNSISHDELMEIKKVFLENCLITNTKNHYLDHEYIVQELNKIYHYVLENTFIVDKEIIDWNKNIRMIESRFLAWIHTKNLKQDQDLKDKLLSIMANLNEKEEVSYYSKYNILIESLKGFDKFVYEFENRMINPTPENYKYYEICKASLFGLKFIDQNFLVDYLDYDKIMEQLQKLPDDSSKWDYNFTLDLNIRIFYASMLSNIITSQTISVWGAKIEMLKSNGGWVIGKEKEVFRNLYIALTQSNENIKNMITISTKQLNRNLIQLAKDLLNKYNNKMNNNLYNQDILNSYFEQLDKLIQYHEAGVSDTFLAHPNEILDGFDIKIADALLDFDNMIRIQEALIKLDNNLEKHSKGNLLKTIEFIKIISDVEVF